MASLCRRFPNNPLMTPEDLKPSRPDFVLTGVLNAGAFEFDGQYCWLVRVAEAPIQTQPGKLVVPYMEVDAAGRAEMCFRTFDRNDPTLDLRDTRLVFYKDALDKPWITNISHLRMARSDDGLNWRIDDSVQLWPRNKYEAYGIEDPRIVQIDGEYLVTYSAISRHGVTSNLLVTRDFKSFDYRGQLFVPDNKDICIFPEKVNGRYVALHRPSVSMLGRPDIWIAYSDDLVHWGGHEAIMYCRPGQWDSGRIGCGPAPVKTEKGWLEIYHGSDDRNYYLGAVLLDLDDPRKVIARSETPILMPEEPYELEGFFANVVFANGQIAHDDGRIWIYDGGADRVMAGCETTVAELFKHLGV